MTFTGLIDPVPPTTQREALEAVEGRLREPEPDEPAEETPAADEQ